MRNDLILIIDKRVRHAGWHEDVFAQVLEKLRARCALDHAAYDRVSIGAVTEFRAGLEQQRIGSENGKAIAHAVVVLRTLHLVVLVVANSRGVGEEFAGRYGPLFLRESGAVLLHGSIEIEFAGLHQRHGGDGGKWLRNRSGTDQRVGRGGKIIFDVRCAESLSIDDLTAG